MQPRLDGFAGPGTFAVGESCNPKENFFGKSGRNRVQEQLEANNYCLLIDHRLGGKSTLAKAVVRPPRDASIVCYIFLAGVKVSTASDAVHL